MLSYHQAKVFQHADKQAHLWTSAMLVKKTAMENLLKAQKLLEEFEVSITKCLSKESVENAHTRFLSPLHPANPDALYLLTIGWAVVRPLSSHLRPSYIRPTWKGSVCTRSYVANPTAAHT